MIPWVRVYIYIYIYMYTHTHIKVTIVICMYIYICICVHIYYRYDSKGPNITKIRMILDYVFSSRLRIVYMRVSYIYTRDYV